MKETPEYSPKEQVKSEPVNTEIPVRPEMKETPEYSPKEQVKSEPVNTEIPVRPEIKDSSAISESLIQSDEGVEKTHAEAVISEYNISTDKQAKVNNSHETVSSPKNYSPDQVTEKTVISVQSETQTGSEDNPSFTDSSDSNISENAKTDSKQLKSEENRTSDFEEIMRNTVTLSPLHFMKASSVMSDTITEQQISSQTYRALNESIIKGRKHFIIKLSPEGLGDITVKLIKSEDSVLVRMSASDEKTAQLLNRELDVLQNLLKPHNAEIETVTTYKESTTDMQNSSFDQGFRSNQHDGQRNGSHRNMTYFTQSENTEEEQTLNIMPSIIGNTILNRFI